MSENLGANEADILAYAEERLNLWRKWHRIWITVHFTLGVSAVALSLAITLMPVIYDKASKSFLAILSLISTLFVILVAFATPPKQARSYIAAWRGLDAAIIRHRFDPTRDSLNAVLSAVDEGEQILAGKDPY